MRGADSDVPLSDQVRLAHAVTITCTLCMKFQYGSWKVVQLQKCLRLSIRIAFFCKILLLMQVTIQTFSQAIASAKEQLARSLLK